MVDCASRDSEAYALKDAEDVITMLSAFDTHRINEDDKTRVRTLIAETAIAYSDASEVEMYDLMTKLEILSSPVIATRLKSFDDKQFTADGGSCEATQLNQSSILADRKSSRH